MKEFELFIQGEGIAKIILVRVSSASTVRALVEAAMAHGLHLSHEGGALAFVENEETELDQNAILESAGITNRSRVHIHSCKKIKVTVHFNAESASEASSPSSTVAKIKRWADDHFKLAPTDATEHVLQICGSATRPDEDVHLGTLATKHCEVCFDLVPKKRVEG